MSPEYKVIFVKKYFTLNVKFAYLYTNLPQYKYETLLLELFLGKHIKVVIINLGNECAPTYKVKSCFSCPSSQKFIWDFVSFSINRYCWKWPIRRKTNICNALNIILLFTNLDFDFCAALDNLLTILQAQVSFFN